MQVICHTLTLESIHTVLLQQYAEMKLLYKNTYELNIFSNITVAPNLS